MSEDDDSLEPLDLGPNDDKWLTFPQESSDVHHAILSMQFTLQETTKLVNPEPEQHISLNMKLMKFDSSALILAERSWSNCSHILFSKLPWPGDSEGTFRYLSQATTCLPHWHWRRHTVPSIAKRQPGSCEYQFLSFWLNPTWNWSQSIVSVADALSTRPLTGWNFVVFFCVPFSHVHCRVFTVHMRHFF